MATTTLAQRAALTVAAAASVLLLAACAPVGNTPVEKYAGEPVIDHGEHGDEEHAEEEEMAEGGLEGEPQAIWLNDGGRIALTLWGSSGCPFVGSSIDVVEPAGEGNTVAINLEEMPADKACTLDLAPYTTVFSTPLNIATTEELTVQVQDIEIFVPIK